VFVTFENLHVYRPQIHENNGAVKLMFPQEARLRNFTYASALTIDINVKYIVRTGTELQNTQIFHKIFPKIHIGKLPIMLKSNICLLNQYKHFSNIQTGECKYDSGGYFIINGSEKTVLGQERAAENRVYVFNISKNNTKYSWIAEIKSVPDFKCISPKQINLLMSSKNNGFGNAISVQIPRIKQPIPLFILFRALGVISDKEICEIILLSITDTKKTEMLHNLQASVIEANKYLTQIESIKYITTYCMFTPINMDRETGAQKKHEFTMDILNNDLFPHCSTPKQKIYFLGYAAHKLLMVYFKVIDQDDRDSYVNKRVDLTGSLLNNLFRNYFNKLVKDMEKQVIKEINNGSWKSTDDYENIINLTNIYKIIKSTTIENGLKRALGTGDFGVKNTNSNKVGVAQVLNRLTYVSSLSHARRISTPTDKSGKLIPPRKLHNTSWGFLCPAETPEGQSVGLVKNLSYMTHVTIGSHSVPIYEYVMPNIISIDSIINPADIYEKIKVFINGSFVGITDEAYELFLMLKDKKHRGILNIYTSIVFDYKMQEIRICNDGGRLTRPVLRVKDKNILITKDIMHKLNNNEIGWNDLLTTKILSDAIIEYIDPEEQSWSMIATNPKDLFDKSCLQKFTHCEIHPSTIFGILGSCIPFPEHNQSPRNTYQCAQAKQAMGMYVTSFQERMDKTAYVLNYPARPLVDTRVMNMIQLNKIPSGTNVIVAIMTHTGYNQEDSLLINKGSIDRGMSMVTVYHTEKDEDKQKINGDEEIRCRPDTTKTKGMKMGNYSKVNSKGVMPENTLVENRDIIIAKVIPIKENKNDHTKVIKFEDQSKIYKTNEETYIDKNYIDRNGDGYNFAKVRLRTTRKPVIGDKFSSRHGQKGTVGNIIPECDMPFNSKGVRPDIIINPHAIPSRMTIGQLKETLLGKVLVELGLFGDGTSFGQLDVKDICSELIKLGYESNGNELLYNGLTGEQHEYSIFMGPVFYQRLKHMVNDKTHSRSIGPMVNLTRQPAEGRSRDGGLRFGEMERDCEYENTAITTTNGLSVFIKNMGNCTEEVLGWDEETDQLVPSKQTGFLYKGERPCLQLTFQDGRTKICTPDHPILTSNNKWVKAKDLTIYEKVKAGLTCPVVDFEEEIKECNGWELQVGKLSFKTDTIENFKKTLVLCKLIGYLITDGNINKTKNGFRSTIYFGHMIDVNSFITDIKLLCETKQINFKSKNLYFVNIPTSLISEIVQIKGILVGKKVNQHATLPEFILDPKCPKPIVREFLGGMFGGDGHTCVLAKHRGKRDVLSSVSFSQTKNKKQLESLTQMMLSIQLLLSKFDIQKVTIQNHKETSDSKNKNNETRTENDKNYQITLHLDISELISFQEKIGFRYCCHKSQRLEAAVSYKRLRNEVIRQHNKIIKRVDEITNFTKLKTEHPNKIIHTKKAIEQAVQELQLDEPLVHKYAIPSTHDITDNLIKGTQNSKFNSTVFPTAEEYLRETGSLTWFINKDTISYGVKRENMGLPTMNLSIIDIRDVGIKPVYDIQVDKTHSFLANGIVSHNCMVSHGAARFTKGRMYDASDKYSVHACKKCGLIAAYNDKNDVHHCKTCDNRVDFAYIEIPYSCKLLFQELNTMNVVPRFITT
jgi:DNA-directed RNA polymerase II subunit RPB2